MGRRVCRPVDRLLFLQSVFSLGTAVSLIAEPPPWHGSSHLQGQVQVDAVLDAQGNVIEMKVVSGAPLLYQAALDALKKWKYQPTYLNDQPIAVQMLVTVTFVLGQ